MSASLLSLVLACSAYADGIIPNDYTGHMPNGVTGEMPNGATDIIPNGATGDIPYGATAEITLTILTSVLNLG